MPGRNTAMVMESAINREQQQHQHTESVNHIPPTQAIGSEISTLKTYCIPC